MDLYMKIFTDTIVRDKDDFNKLINVITPKMFMKDNKSSELKRRDGNKLFLKKYHTAEEHENIFKFYCESIAYALPNSEHLAYAYGNRSAFLMHIKKFKESISDIERALEITSTDVFKVKLLCRKAEYLKGFNLTENEIALKEAKEILQKVSDSDQAKKTLIELVQKTENNLNKTNSFLMKEQLKNLQEDDELDIKETNIFESVSVKYDEKYRRYVVANRDFQPGEIIYTEKYYTACLNLHKKYTYCYHCMKCCYTLIPCDECYWALFCSEDCKNQAFSEYHKHECSLIQILRIMAQETLVECKLPVRLLLLALEEAGGIENLRSELEKIDNDPDAARQIASPNKKVEYKFTSIYKLNSCINPDPNYYESKVKVSIPLIKLLFKDKWNLEAVEDIIENENIVFIGGLFLKIWGIKTINCFMLSEISPILEPPSVIENEKQVDNLSDSIGTCILIITSMLNHSCNANMSFAFGKDQKLVAFAMQPIKKNTQLFMHYRPMFFSFSKAERLKSLKHYNFKCDCDACEKNWPTYNFRKPMMLQPSTDNKLNMDQVELAQKIQNISEAMKKHYILKRKNYIDMITNLSRCIVKALSRLPPYSEIICRLYFLMKNAVGQVYGIKSIKFDEGCQKK